METAKKDYSSAINRVKEIITSESLHTQVLCVYGENESIRKQLGEEIKKEISTETNRIIDFDIPLYEGVAERLARLSMIIRNEQKRENVFPRFDYAYIKYMESRGYHVKNASKKKRITDSSLYNIAISVTKMWFFKAAPVSEILETIKNAIEIYDQMREGIEQRSYHDIRKEIDQLAMTPSLLTRSLPQYFAEDLNACLENSKSRIFYLDSYCEQMLQSQDDWLLGESGVIRYVQGTKWLIMSKEKLRHIDYKDSNTYFTDLPLYEMTLDTLEETKSDLRPLAELLFQMDDFQKEMLYALDCLGMWNEYVIRETLICEKKEALSVYLSLRYMLKHYIRTEGAVCHFHLTEMEIMPEEYSYEKRLRLLKKMEAILSGKDSKYFSEKEKLLYFGICFHIMEGMDDELNEPLLEWLNTPFMDVAKYLLNENDGEKLCKFCEQAEGTYRNGHYGIIYQLLILRYCAQALCEKDTANTEKKILELSNLYSVRGELDYPLEAAYAGKECMYRLNMYREMNFLSEAVSRIINRRYLYYQYCAVHAKAKSYLTYDQNEHEYIKYDIEQAGNSSGSRTEQTEEERKRKIVDMRYAVKNPVPNQIDKEFCYLYEAFQSDKEDPLYLNLLDIMTEYYTSVSLNVDREQMNAYLRKYMDELKRMSNKSSKAKEIYKARKALHYNDYESKIKEIYELIERMTEKQEEYKGELHLYHSEIRHIIAMISVNVTSWTGPKKGLGMVNKGRKMFESVFLELYKAIKHQKTIDFDLLATLADMTEINCQYFTYVPKEVMDDIDVLMKESQKIDADQILHALAMFYAGWGNNALIERKQKYSLNLPPEERRGGLHLEKYFTKYGQCFNRLYQILQEKYEEEMQKYTQGELPGELAERYKKFLMMMFSGAIAGDRERAYEILSMLGVDCEAEKRASRRKTDTTMVECPKAEMLGCIMDYSFTEKENLSVETDKMVNSVIKGLRRLQEEYCEKYVKDILWCAEEYESNKWHEPFEALPEKLKSGILLQKGRK